MSGRWDTGLYPGGDGEPLKVSEQSRDLTPQQRREMIITVKGRGSKH